MIRNFIFCFALLLSASTYAQLPGFTLNVSVTPEPCVGSVGLDLTIGGLVEGATHVVYTVYEMPDETPILTSLGGPAPDFSISFTLFQEGEYKVIAQQFSDSLEEISVEEEIVTILFDDGGPVEVLVGSQLEVNSTPSES